MSKVFHAAKWSVLGEVAAKALTPLSFILLARLLTPEDFGLVATAAIVVAFSNLFWQAGLGKALVQTSEDADKAANVVFWSNLCLAALIYGIVFSIAGYIAQGFGDKRIEAVLRLQALSLFAGALASVQTSLCQKDLEFKSLFYVRLIGSSGPYLLSIPLAIVYGNYWALVWGMLAGGYLQFIILWWIRPWRPKFGFNKKVARALFGFSVWSGLEAFLTWFFTWGDALLLGIYLSTTDLGTYRVGANLVNAAFGIMIAPLVPVIFSKIASEQKDLKKVRTGLARAVRVFSVIGFSAAVIFFVNGTRFADILFGDRWEGVGTVIAWYGLSIGLAAVVKPCTEAIRGVGQARLATYPQLITMPVYVLIYCWSLEKGLDAFLMARVCLIIFAVNVYAIVVSNSVIKYKYTSFLRDVIPALLIGSFSFVVSKNIVKLYYFGDCVLADLVISVFPVVASAFIALYFIEKALITSVAKPLTEKIYVRKS